MPSDAAADRRAELERMALRLAFDADALEQRGADASAQDFAAVAAAADELRRAWLTHARELGDDDATVLLARTLLEYLGRESMRSAIEATGPVNVFAEAMREWRAAIRRARPAAARQACAAPAPWAISGSYLEACNCEPMCSCRSAQARRLRRPRGGVCMGALSWSIDRGHADEVELNSLAIVLAFHQDQDAPDPSWEIVVYLDQRAIERQRSALTSLFTGSRDRPAPVPFPWASTASHRVAVRTAPILADHDARWPWFDAGDYVSVRAGEPICTHPCDTSLIPGHQHAGIERRGRSMRVVDRSLAFDYGSHRAFQSRFAYAAAAA